MRTQPDAGGAGAPGAAAGRRTSGAGAAGRAFGAPVVAHLPAPHLSLPEEERAGGPAAREINAQARSSRVLRLRQQRARCRRRTAVEANADILARNPTWRVAVEGHCRLASTPSTIWRSANAVRTRSEDHRVAPGIPPDQCRTISYGEEFPFVPGETEDAWSANRRAHFVVTGQ